MIFHGNESNNWTCARCVSLNNQVHSFHLSHWSTFIAWQNKITNFRSLLCFRRFLILSFNVATSVHGHRDTQRILAHLISVWNMLHTIRLVIWSQSQAWGIWLPLKYNIITTGHGQAAWLWSTWTFTYFFLFYQRKYLLLFSFYAHKNTLMSHGIRIFFFIHEIVFSLFSMEFRTLLEVAAHPFCSIFAPTNHIMD